MSAEGPTPPLEARIVRAAEDGAPVVTDGPFPESKEFLAGYWIVEVDRLGRAYAIAADRRIAGHFRLDAVRAHLYERAGDLSRAAVHFRAAAERAENPAERVPRRPGRAARRVT